ncbi:MAG: glycosyltransferase family 39 protein, partial [Sedimentisphaerales bacterium]
MSNVILTKYRSFWICAALTFGIIAVFYRVHSFEFVNYDDPVYVCTNSNIQAGFTLKAIKWALTTGHTGYWHSLTWLSLMLDYQFFKGWAGGYHIVNVLFHILNTLILFYVLMRMTGAVWPSAFVAAAFALHPLHVESVAWVSERKDVLSTFFWLLTMWAYVRYTVQPKIGRYLLVVLFFALGLMSKPMLVTLPFVLLLLDYWPLERFDTKRPLTLLIEKIPLFVMVLASSIV